MAAFVQLFRRYEAALNECDTDTIASCHADRFLHLTRRDDTWSHEWRRNNAEFRALLAGAARWYEQLGARSFKALGLTETKLHQSHSLLRVMWQVLGAQGTELVSFEVTYMARVRSGEAKIVGLVAHNERKRLEERGLFDEGAKLYFDMPLEDSLLASGVRSTLDARRTG